MNLSKDVHDSPKKKVLGILFSNIFEAAAAAEQIR
jgi:hypothetical protein